MQTNTQIFTQDVVKTKPDIRRINTGLLLTHSPCQLYKKHILILCLKLIILPSVAQNINTSSVKAAVNVTSSPFGR